MPEAATSFSRFQELQRYVGWTDADTERVKQMAPIVDPSFPKLCDDFYEAIRRNDSARRVIDGGEEQIARLKGTLATWLRELFAGRYDAQYVTRRSNVGRKHVAIGLDQVFTNAAMARLRRGLIHALIEGWPAGNQTLLPQALVTLNTLLDLDLAIIEDAYQSEYANRLQASERLATIGKVAGGVAHELRNPLNVVKTSVYFLLNAADKSDEKRAEHLERINRNVGLADNVIAALLNFARMPIPNLVSLRVADCIAGVLEQNPLPANIRVRVECPPDLPEALGDGQQLSIVLGNLVRNARDAMPDGGDLTISAQGGNGSICVQVADTGAGIDEATLSRILEPLYTTKTRGLGLGLAIAKAIVERHRGSLEVRSRPGAGSQFTIRLQAFQPDQRRTP